MSKGTQIIIAIFIVIMATIGLAFLAHDASADGPQGSNDLEWRVSHLEGDVRGTYANTAYLTQQVIALQARIAKLEVCREDMPCWDCHTMGNHMCGSVVSRPEFNRVIWVVQDDLRRHEVFITSLRHNVARMAHEAKVTRSGLRACLRNRSYIGRNTEDNRWLFAQCLDDYGVPR